MHVSKDAMFVSRESCISREISKFFQILFFVKKLVHTKSFNQISMKLKHSQYYLMGEKFVG